MKPEWLERGFVHGPHYTLCLNEKDFLTAVKHCNPKLTHNDFTPWADPGKACTHHFKDKNDRRCCVVCMNNDRGYTGIVVAGLLVHEAVHIFQIWCEDAGEHAASREFMAYSVQWLSQQLMWEYQRQSAADANVVKTRHR